jgi:tetratricopeptide (TPR) repeat protein
MHALLAALEHDRKRRNRRLAGLVLACLLGAGAATAMAWLPSMPTPEQLAEVDALVEGAREAAGQRHYLVPPADDPTAVTAYAWVRRLEQIEGPAAEAAVERAASLRGDFASALVELGDAYWDEEGGKPYAADYYAWALVFDDGNARARARAMLTHGELRSVLARAEASTFDAADRLTADALEFLAEARAREQGARIGELRSRRPRAASALASGARGSDARRAAVRSIGADPNPPAATRPDPPAPVLAAPPRAAEGAARRSRRPDDESHRARRSAARTLSREGRASLATGRDREADALFHRALELDPRDATALEGLARLQFDRGRNNEALRWVELAVKAAPRNAGLRLLSGDIHMRVLEYAAARRHYERAAKLGHGKAQGRLRLLDEELGR